MPLLYEQPAPVDASSAPRLAIREASQSIRGRGLSAEPIAQTLDQIQDAFSGLMSQLTRVASGRFDELIVTSSGTGEVVGWVGSHDQYQGGWFRNLYIGGTDPTTSPLVADENGRVTLTLGSGTDQGFLAVLDGTGTQVLWAGKTGSNYGLWAKNVWIGGSGPSTAVFWSDGTQTVIGKNGYIAFQNASGVENGWIGARTISAVPYAGGWVKEWRIGGTSAPTAQLVADSSGNVTITGGSLSITSGTNTLLINSTVGFKQSNSATLQDVQILNGIVNCFYSSAKKVEIGAPAGFGTIQCWNSSGSRSFYFDGVSLDVQSGYKVGGTTVISPTLDVHFGGGSFSGTPTFDASFNVNSLYFGGTTPSVPAGRLQIRIGNLPYYLQVFSS